MKNFWKWFLGIALVLVILFALPLVYQWLFPTYGMMGGRFGGYGSMMSGFGFMPFGFLGMGFVPLLLLGLLGLGIYWLVSNTHTTAPDVGGTCLSCEAPTQPGWKVCPHCGTEL